MTTWGSVGAVALALLVLGGAGACWLVAKRPLALFAWATRRSLVKAGLRKVVVEAPAGPQTVFVGGEGPVLVLLHGAGHQAGSWAQVAPSLAKAYSLVIPDLAGHGGSSPPRGPIQADAIFGALETVIPAYARGGRVTVAGNSLGAWMAMVLGARHPEWVERVVAVNGGALLRPASSVNLFPRTREEARKTMAQLRDPASPAVPDSVLDDMVRQVGTSVLARVAAGAGSLGDFLLDEDALRNVKVPVRLVWGVSDQLMPLGYARQMAALLPDAEVIPVERCGHIPQQEAPDRFEAALRKALGGAPASGEPLEARSP